MPNGRVEQLWVEPQCHPKPGAHLHPVRVGLLKWEAVSVAQRPKDRRRRAAPPVDIADDLVVKLRREPSPSSSEESRELREAEAEAEAEESAALAAEHLAHRTRCAAGWLGEDDESRPVVCVVCVVCGPHLVRARPGSRP